MAAYGGYQPSAMPGGGFGGYGAAYGGQQTYGGQPTYSYGQEVSLAYTPTPAAAPSYYANAYSAAPQDGSFSAYAPQTTTASYGTYAAPQYSAAPMPTTQSFAAYGGATYGGAPSYAPAPAQPTYSYGGAVPSGGSFTAYGGTSSYVPAPTQTASFVPMPTTGSFVAQAPTTMGMGGSFTATSGPFKFYADPSKVTGSTTPGQPTQSPAPAGPPGRPASQPPANRPPAPGPGARPPVPPGKRPQSVSKTKKKKACCGLF